MLAVTRIGTDATGSKIPFSLISLPPAPLTYFLFFPLVLTNLFFAWQLILGNITAMWAKEREVKGKKKKRDRSTMWCIASSFSFLVFSILQIMSFPLVLTFSVILIILVPNKRKRINGISKRSERFSSFSPLIRKSLNDKEIKKNLRSSLRVGSWILDLMPLVPVSRSSLPLS